jgi:hypothetical protein
MRTSGKVALGVASVIGVTLSAAAINTDGQLNPYTAIVDRNVFNLRPPPPPQTNVVDTTPASKITLLGIVCGPGPKQVMFKTAVGTPPKEMSYALAEGERAGDVEVVEINEIAGTVRLKNKNDDQNLSLEKDSLKPTGGPLPGLPGLPGVPGRVPPPSLPMPGGMPPVTSAPNPNGGPTGGNSVTTFGAGSTTISRPLRGQAAAVGTMSPQGGIDTSGSGRVATFGTGATPATQAALQAGHAEQQLQAPVSQEHQILMMEVNRKLNAEKINRGMMPPPPPTPLTGQ